MNDRKAGEPEIITKPWSQEQVDSLNRFQQAGHMHPFTCGSGRRTDAVHLDREGVLLATPNGWICPYCDYRQDWAHAFMFLPLVQRPKPSEPTEQREQRAREWHRERVFCNPPWGSIPPFIELASRATFACLLVPARTNCGWFHRALELGAKIEFFKSKLNFGCKWNSPADCLLLIFAPDPSDPAETR